MDTSEERHKGGGIADLFAGGGERSGYPEETYHTFSYGPAPDDNGEIGGMLCVVTEDTERVLGERRLALLRELGTDFAATNTEEEVFAALTRRILARPQDLPFALVYLFDAAPHGETRTARLACACGAPAGSPVAPESIDLDRDGGPWPFSNVSHEFRPPLTLMLGPLEDILGRRDGEVPTDDRRLLEVVHRNSLRLQKLVNMLLDFARIEAGPAHDGLSAIQAIADYRPAVALLDIGMPGMDGYEVARRIRERPEFQDVLLVALTGWGQEEDRRRSAQAGFNRHLVKPVDPEVLQGLLAAL